MKVHFSQVKLQQQSATPDVLSINPLMPNDVYSRHTVSPLKIKIPSKNMCEKPTNTPTIHSVY
jgi:hypothetical protein